MKDDSVYVRHMLEAISRIEDYVGKTAKKDFKKNTLLQDAVIRQIEIIGEAVKQLSEEMKGKHPKVPWKDIAGMRDKLIHGYFGVDMDLVWETVKRDIPQFKKQLLGIQEYE